MNSVGPILNDMPENQLALDHSNQSSPREPIVMDGEEDMQKFVANFVIACENEQKHA